MTPDLDLDDDGPGAEEGAPRSAPIAQRPDRVRPEDAEFGGARTVDPQRNGHTHVEPDPETGLLACCLIEDDNGAVLARCEEAGLIGDSFREPKRGLVYSRLQSMRREGKPIGTATLAIEMAAAKELDRIGGYGFIVAITSSAPTTAQAAYFVERVRELSILREIVRQSKLRAELAESPSADLPDLLIGYQRDAAAVSEKGISGEKAGIMARAFNPERLIAKLDQIYSIGGVPVCTPGNLTTIYSQAKTGKSSFEAAMMSAAMSYPTDNVDTLGVEGPNYAKHAVVHFDTEQSPYDWQQLVQSSLKRANLSLPPPWLMSFTIAGMEATKGELFVLAALRLARKTHGGIHSVFIDGVADLVNDPNSPDECFPLIARLHAAAIQYNTAIINILHLNPTAKDKSDKGRGHLGSQLERKSESNLTLKKDGDVTVLVAEGRQRGRPIPPDKAPAFRWSDEHQMHRTCANPASDEPMGTKGRKPTWVFSDLRPIFPAHAEPPKRMKELHRSAMQIVPIKNESIFYNVLQRFAEQGQIEVVDVPGGRGYRLAI